MLKENLEFESLIYKTLGNTKERKEHFFKFVESGFPSKKLEDWKFSDLKSIINKNIKELKFGFNTIENKSYNLKYIKNFEHSKIVILNGEFLSADILDIDKNKIEIKNENLIFSESLNEPLNNLNKAFASRLIKLNVLEDKIVEKPLVIYHICDLDNKTNLINTRFELTLHKNSSLSTLNLFEDKSVSVFNNHNFNIVINKNSNLKNYIFDLLESVELTQRSADRYPHEFSGGQRQRISIARALASRPEILICDEPTSALDVSVQANILNLLKDLQEELSLTMLFISHDLPVIRQMCNRVAVMQNGKICEIAETDSLFDDPQHEYSKHLLGLMPRMDLFRL